MRFHAITVVLGLGLSCGVWSSACSAPDPGAVTFVQQNRTVGTGSSSGGTSSSSSSSSSSSGSSSSGDGGSSSGGVDAGHDAGPPNAFTSKPTFTAGTSLQSSDQGGHNNQFNGTNNPNGNDCTQCHKNGGAAPEMAIGGGAVTAGGAATAGIEVRVVNAATGKEVADAFTDELGNFYVNNTALNGTYAVGIRSAQKTSLMVGTVTNGACNQGGTCHGNGGTQGSIKLQ